MSVKKSSAGFIATKSEWAKRLNNTATSDYLVAFDNAECLIEYWALRVPDTQGPHDRDEAYILIAGNGDFNMNGEERAVEVGDMIFVPAGTPHRFTRFSTDLAMWIVFFGPHHEEFKQWRGKEY